MMVYAWVEDASSGWGMERPRVRVAESCWVGLPYAMVAIDNRASRRGLEWGGSECGRWEVRQGARWDWR